jgi:hypothetical protein
MDCDASAAQSGRTEGGLGADRCFGVDRLNNSRIEIDSGASVSEFKAIRVHHEPAGRVSRGWRQSYFGAFGAHRAQENRQCDAVKLKSASSEVQDRTMTLR